MRKYNKPFVLDGELAVKYGDREALMITHFQFWIDINKANGNNFKDGRTWTYQTYKAIAAHFPFWTMRRVRTLLDSLVEQGVLVKGNYNKCGFDKTVWYAFKNEEMFTIAENGNGVAENGLPIPESKPESKPFLRKDNVSRERPKPKTPPKRDTDETLSFASAKRKDTGKTIHPLKKGAQQDTYDLLQALGIEADHDCLCSLIRSHRSDDLLMAISEYRSELDRGVQVKRTRIAFFRSILKRIACPQGRNEIKNKSWLKEFASSYGIKVDFQSKAAIFENGKELPYSFHHQAFKEDTQRITGVYTHVF